MAMGVMGITLWGIGIAGAGSCKGKKFCQSGNLGYYLANSLLMMAVALSLSYLVGQAYEKQQYAQRSGQCDLSGNVLSVRGICTHECDGPESPESFPVSASILV
ncbi:MAG: hypothetical protein ACLUTA_15180 [Blautia wexlerae]